MTKRKLMKKGKASKSSALESLRQRGLRVDAFAEGYEARDAIVHAGQLVKQMRVGAKLTQAALAKRAGMSQPEVSRIESGLGTQGPSVETIDRLAEACGMGLVMGMRDLAVAADNVNPNDLKYLVEM